MNLKSRVLLKIKRELVSLFSVLFGRNRFKELFSINDIRNSSMCIKSNNCYDVHMFWAYGQLSKLEIISINSFLKNDFKLNVWSYDPHLILPTGAQWRDASEIIPENLVFKYKNGSYAGIADLFRYAVLNKLGGMWSDTDVVCLISLDKFLDMNSCGFFVTERTKDFGKVTVNNNLIYHPLPKKGDAIDVAYNFALTINKDNLDWGDIGPKLLRVISEHYPNLRPELMEPDFCNSINFWDCPKRLLTTTALPSNAAFVHLYNEMWRARGISKIAPYPVDSLMAEFEKMYYKEIS